MKKKVFCVLLLVGIMILAFMGKEAKSQVTVIKAVTAFPKSNANNDPVPLFIEAVNKRTQGRVQIDWLGGPEVFATFDQIHALKAGTIDAILYYPWAFMKSLMPEAEAQGLSEITAWEERKSGVFELWTEIFEKRVNAKFLGRFHSNLRFRIFTNKKVEKIADFKGQTLRVMPLYIPFIKALGGNPVTIPPSEMYTSVERGVVDGVMYAEWSMASFGLHEVLKYTIEPPVFQLEPATMINLDRWKRIPKDSQDQILDAMKDYEYIATMRSFMLLEKENKMREKAGMKIIVLPPEDAAKYTKLAYDTTWEQILKTSPEYGPKLKKAMSKEAVPKGSFPWQ